MKNLPGCDYPKDRKNDLPTADYAKNRAPMMATERRSPMVKTRSEKAFDLLTNASRVNAGSSAKLQAANKLPGRMGQGGKSRGPRS